MPRQRIHLINQFEEIGGSEHRALDLARILMNHADVRLWATDQPDARLSGPVPIARIDPRWGRFPRAGTFVFVGTYFRVGAWMRLARPSRRIIIFNTPDVEGFKALERSTARTLTSHAVPCEVEYASDALQSMLGRPGIIIESPINIRTFQPRQQPCRNSPSRFRVGRLSRDVPEKFHEDDPALFSALAGHDIDVRLMGGACVGFPTSPRIAVTAPGTRPAQEFLRSLDCFVYRTRSTWLEGFGRVVFEAMACGLPVVAGRTGGYANYIEHGVNVFLFDTSEQALAHIMQLRDDPALRQRIGANARRSVEQLYSERHEEKVVNFYTGRMSSP